MGGTRDRGDVVRRPASRLIRVSLDEASLGGASRDIEHERAVAIEDLLEHNEFALEGAGGGPFALALSLKDNRLTFEVRDVAGGPASSFILSLKPFRRIVKDYFLLCESYYEAIRTAPPNRIEAIDAGRRGLHDEGTHILLERLEGKVRVDFDTARRLFTLICVLHWRDPRWGR